MVAHDRASRARLDHAVDQPQRAELAAIDEVAQEHGGPLGMAPRSAALTVKDRLAQLEHRRTELEAQLQEGSDEESVVALHSAAPARYRRLVERLLEVLEQPETLEIATARDAFRAMIRSVTVTAQPDGGHDVPVETELGPRGGGGGGGGGL